MAVTYSVRVSGEGIDSFLGFEYCDVITFASRVFHILLPLFHRTCGFCAVRLGYACPAVGLR